jgi:hypothetical protein
MDEFSVLELETLTLEDASRCDLVNDKISLSACAKLSYVTLLTNARTMDRDYQ